jgi:DNA/RNA non-specific endonuclease
VIIEKPLEGPILLTPERSSRSNRILRLTWTLEKHGSTIADRPSCNGGKSNGSLETPWFSLLDLIPAGPAVSGKATAAVGAKLGAALGPVVRKMFGAAEAEAIDNAVVKAGTGFVDYGTLDSLGRPTGVTAVLTKDMIGNGSGAASHIIPPGYVPYRQFPELGGQLGGLLPFGSRAHLLARTLGGLGNIAENLVTFAMKPSNSPIMRDFEKAISKVLLSGERVFFSSTPIYVGSELIGGV